MGRYDFDLNNEELVNENTVDGVLTIPYNYSSIVGQNQVHLKIQLLTK